MARKVPRKVVLWAMEKIRATEGIAVLLLNNCSLNGMCACMLVVYYGEKERVSVEVRVRIKEIFIRPNYESHAMQFSPFTHETRGKD